MKRLLFSLLALSNLFLIGCMDSYYLKDYKSKKKFYDFVNQKSEDRSVDVKMKDGKIYETDILKINKDTTLIKQPITKIKVGNQTAFSKAEIQNIEYKKFNPSGIGNTAEITFNSGKKILVQDLMSNKDSIFISSRAPIIYLTKELVPIPTTEIKMVSYNNRLKGLAEFIGIGFITGLLIGTESSANLPPLPYMGGGSDPAFVTIALTLVGGLSGVLIGPIVGSRQDYIFIEPEEFKGWSAFGILGGIGIDNIKSSLDNNPNYIRDGIVKYTFGGYVTWSFNKNIALRAELLKTTKGGSYETDYTSNYQDVSYISTAYLNFLEVPILFQYSFPNIYFHPRFYAGPALSFFLNGSINKVPGDYSYPVNNIRYERDITGNEVNSPDIDLIVGTGINLKGNITIDFRYDWGLRTLSNNLFEGQAGNLKLKVFSIIMGYEF